MSYKNPKNIGLFVAVWAFFVYLLLQLLLIINDPYFLSTFTIILIFLSAILISLVIYFVTVYLIEKFIYKKIKVLYKSMHSQGKIKDSRSIKADEDLISRVEKEILSITNQSKTEIQDLKKMDEYRKEFLGNVSHELKTPIFNIQGYLHTLIDGGLDNPKVNMDFLLKATQNLDRLSNIVEDLEFISRFESMDLTIDITKFDFIKLVNEIIENLEMQADLRDIKLKLGSKTPEKAMVKADKDRIRQVLNNLIINSIKYGKEGGTTTISLTEAEENVIIEVIDDGPGISEEHLPRLFERFYRVDKSRSRNIGGTGLGLSIVKHILEAHDKNINVKSKPGIGTTFTFQLEKA
ncbi:MAG: sensor histidine kinase [Chitinophagaceae bacterium]|nr:MAG: sensor histidine kinase [Chitinophagaceae bacterium]